MLVSVVIPTYKRSDTLIRAIQSALSQTYTPIEVLVVDDNIPGSDASKTVKELLEVYSADNRVKYISQEKHINGAAARNVGINRANGEYIAFLDDDDEWLPAKTEKQMNLLLSDENIGGVTCLYSICESGQEIRKCKPYTANDLQFKVLVRKVAICTPTFLAKKELLLSYGAFNQSLERHQDLQLFVDFLDVANIQPLNEYLVKINADSTINRPNVEKTIAIKEQFFDAVKDTLQKYSKEEQMRIRNAHYFEVVFGALKARKIGIAIKYFVKMGFSISAYKDVFARVKDRI